MAWTVLFIAGVFEVAWAVALKYSDGVTKLWPSIIFGVSAWVSFAWLAYALKTLPVGTSYAIWTGIGAVGIATFGIVWLGEPASAIRIACIAMIVIGVFQPNLRGLISMKNFSLGMSLGVAVCLAAWSLAPSAYDLPYWTLLVKPQSHGVEVMCLEGCAFETLSADCGAESELFVLELSQAGVSGSSVDLEVENSVLKNFR